LASYDAQCFGSFADEVRTTTSAHVEGKPTG
jgi:hypothetical protein